MNEYKRLQELCDAYGISSFENSVVEIIKKRAKHEDISYEMDGLGSIILKKNQQNIGPKLLIDAHMDEVGFIAKEITDTGFIKLQPIGSWWTHMLLGQDFVVINEKQAEIMGVIASKATHGLPAKIKNKTVAMDDIYLDIGVESSKEVDALNIKIGDMIAPRKNFEVMNNKYLLSKAFDDRVGVHIGYELMQRLKDNTQHPPLYLACATQEEPGLRGARTSSYLVEPDIAIAIDTTLAGDTPLDKNSVGLGKGVVISMLDSNTIYHRGLVRMIEKLCEKANIKHQLAVFTKGGTDSGNIHKAFGGVPTITLSIPIRYMHTNRSIINYDDVESCINLLELLVNELNNEILEELINY